MNGNLDTSIKIWFLVVESVLGIIEFVISKKYYIMDLCQIIEHFLYFYYSRKFAKTKFVVSKV